MKKRQLLDRLALGQRVHDDGMTLLVEYPDLSEVPYKEVFGHAVYTRNEWMLFHFEEIVRRFYT